MASAWGTSWLTAWGNSWGDTGSPPVVVETPPVSRGGIDAYHPPYTKRKKRVEDVEHDIIRAYEDATGITAERERVAAIRELKRTAATALSVARRESDAELEALASRIVALKKLELSATAYLERVGEYLAQVQRQEDDDMEALTLIARLV